MAAHKWLPEYDFGVVTKIDYEEAYAPGIIVRNILLVMFILAIAGTAINLVYARVLGSFQNRALKAEREVKRLGQYTLEHKIGEGGMGEVYSASHAMLRRPTAVKLLRPERSSEDAITRFEREVQLTARLTHPNTIAIYDYGRTPEGVFYYAMEYLDGFDLNRVVELDGPQTAGRVISVLQQICDSLQEAHKAGLIHRDIKPANVILCCRGGMYDVVKVLDFGLVKDVAEEPDASDRKLGGTPVYMSPESIERPEVVDARSDIYSVGAVGYFLITGTNLFKGATLLEICAKQISKRPSPPAERLGRPVNEDLAELIMRCLEKDPAQRPQSASELSNTLANCDSAGAWSQTHAQRWWESRESKPASDAASNIHVQETVSLNIGSDRVDNS